MYLKGGKECQLSDFEPKPMEHVDMLSFLLFLLFTCLCTEYPGKMLKFLIIFPSALETLKIYVVGQNCPPVLWSFQVQRTDPARVERNTAQVWHLKEVNLTCSQRDCLLVTPRKKNSKNRKQLEMCVCVFIQKFLDPGMNLEDGFAIFVVLFLLNRLGWFQVLSVIELGGVSILMHTDILSTKMIHAFFIGLFV